MIIIYLYIDILYIIFIMSKITITQEIYDFILEDQLFSLLVNLDIRLLKSCMDAAIRKLVPSTANCPNMTSLSRCAKLIMKLKKMQMGHEGNPEYELNTLRELVEFEYINKTVLKEWCIEHLARRFRHYDNYYNAEIFEAYARAPLHSAEQGKGNAKIFEATIPEHFYNDFIEIMNKLDVPKQETEAERLAREADEDSQTRAFDEKMKAEARERGRALFEEHRRQGAAIVQQAAQKDRDELDPENIFRDFGGKGKRKRTQRRRKQQRKLKHKRYSSRYKRKSKSRR